MAELGYSLMILFEMQASHLFCITDDRQKAFKSHLKKTYSNEEIKVFLEKHDINEFGYNAKYEIDFGEERWTAPNEKIYDADKFTIHNASYDKDWELLFNYDYGDDWNVKLVLEKCEKKEVSLATLPNVIGGAGFGIVEDVGGTGGLKNFTKIMKKGKGKDFKEMSEWYGVPEFDITHFDKEDLNFRLKN